MLIRSDSWHCRYYSWLRSEEISEKTNLCFYVQFLLWMTAALVFLSPVWLTSIAIGWLPTKYKINKYLYQVRPDDSPMRARCLAGIVLALWLVAITVVPAFVCLCSYRIFMWLLAFAAWNTGLAVGLAVCGIVAPWVIYLFKGYICPIVQFQEVLPLGDEDDGAL